jgi:periplasmic protein CpxP/Spy
MQVTRSARSLAVALALLLVPTAVWAQSAATQVPARDVPENKAADNGVEARVEARIKDLRAKLHITPAQEPQWDQFAQVMRQNARDMNQAGMNRAQQIPSMNAVQDMKSYQQLAEAHVQRLQKLIPAFEALYNAMPPQQQQLADQVFRDNADRRAQSRAGR